MPTGASYWESADHSRDGIPTSHLDAPEATADPFAAARAQLTARLTRPMPSRSNLHSLDQLVEEIDQLQPLPAVATRIIQLGEDHHFSAHELATVIAADQALTARILRLANSAYYDASRQIGTVRDAVVLIGFRAIRQVAVAACLAGHRPNSAGTSNLDRDEFWRHAIVTGLLAELAARIDGHPQDTAFTAGVLHNIGRLANDQHRPQLLAETISLANVEHLTLHHAQRNLLGYTDADLGGALALHRNFPEPLVEATRDHATRIEHPPLPGSPAATSLAATIAQAPILARTHGLSDAPLASTPPPEFVQPDADDPLKICQ